MTFQIVTVVVLILSIVIHEVAHGYAADRLGDPTARHAGRLTLNPIPHIDLMGSIILPGILLLTGSSFLFGWAKPVPFNLANISHEKRGYASTLIALAGPASNLLLAVIFGVLLRIGIGTEVIGAGAFQVLSAIVITNIALAVFNLLPIPPLDGHHILFDILDKKAPNIKYQMQKFALPLLLLAVFVLWDLVQPLVPFLFTVISGVPIN